MRWDGGNRATSEQDGRVRREHVHGGFPDERTLKDTYHVIFLVGMMEISCLLLQMAIALTYQSEPLIVLISSMSGGSGGRCKIDHAD